MPSDSQSPAISLLLMFWPAPLSTSPLSANHSHGLVCHGRGAVILRSTLDKPHSYHHLLPFLLESTINLVGADFMEGLLFLDPYPQLMERLLAVHPLTIISG
jgi:hypothetical protein